MKEQQQKIQWRKHEFIFAIAITIIALAGRLWYVFHHQADLQRPFVESNTPFNLYKNVLLPDIVRGLSLYLVYVLLTKYVLPRIKNKLSILQVCLAIAILGIILNLAEYRIRQWQFNYPGFTIFFDKNEPRSQLNVAVNFFFAAVLFVVCSTYIALREWTIHIIERSKQSAFNISVTNKVTVFVFTLLAIHFCLTSFELLQERDTLAKYIFIVSGLFAIFISNVYWLFPLKGEDSFFSSRVLIRLLSTSFVYAVPLTVLVHEHGPLAMVYSWAIQLFVITPLTWIYFTVNKERILKLRITQTKLARSEADLQLLRSQVNPHFLFNTLNTLYGTALQESANRTAEGIQMLGDMMRFMLHENHREWIPLQKEIAYLQDYINLQKLRITSTDTITITANISPKDCNHSIAPMLLIPLVENAFKHGISLVQTSWIDIQLTCNNRSIIFEVSNSVHPKPLADTERDKSGIGLNNVSERLQHIYPGRHDFDITSSETAFIIKLSITP